MLSFMSAIDVFDVYDVEDGVRVCKSMVCVEGFVGPVPFLLAFHVASNPKRKLRWLALKEVPGVIAKIGNLTGRRVKDSDGQWVAPAHTSHGGKARGSSSSRCLVLLLLLLAYGHHGHHGPHAQHLKHGIINSMWTS